jgi:hypothetical protein
MEKESKIQFEILNSDKTIADYLQSVKNSSIDIVVAFASKTEWLIDNILTNGNRLNLIVGTINYFSDPIFLESCRKSALHNIRKFSVAVDFRGNESIHWKLFLITPDIVIIGSTNFTEMGMSMIRDTAVLIKDTHLYKEYKKEIKHLQNNNKIVQATSKRFKPLLDKYSLIHRIQLGRRIKNQNTDELKILDFQDWLKQDSNQILPIFIWDRTLTKKEKSIFIDEVKPKAMASTKNNSGNITTGSLSLIGSYEDSKNNKLYQNGEVILILKGTGAYAHFRTADIVLHHRGNWWLCGLRKKEESDPFELSQKIKEVLKVYAKKWLDDEKSFLDSRDLRLMLQEISNY